ncbi:MAG: glycerol-3-phosphate 1-O-acyltransferase PlsY [Alphaproteobacteria bacterium]|nr:glycerol-3-phosphate 1-O-acyltransferase PlsY [Alphaproteobacteria bacterium]
MILLLLICAIGGYLAGSIPFGLVLCYLAGYGDIRKIGSGNIGATNVLRTGNKWLALLTVVLDAFKAGLAAYAAHQFSPSLDIAQFDGQPLNLQDLASVIAGTFGVLGHNFPIWLKFKGGKGVASAFGFILMTQPLVALVALGIWLIMAFTFRYSSLSALTAAAAMPVIAYFMCPPIYAVFYSALAVLIIVRHHANIARLLKGQESKISFKKKG